MFAWFQRLLPQKGDFFGMFEAHAATLVRAAKVLQELAADGGTRKTGKPMTPVVHKKGCKEMEGWEALDYARQRYGLPNSDYDRQQNQQQLIKAMAKKATDKGVLTNPLKLNQLIKAAGKAFILDTGGVPIADFIFTLKGVTGNDLVTLRTNSGTYNSTPDKRFETLSPLTMDMFRAVRTDKLADFVVANPGVLSTRK